MMTKHRKCVLTEANISCTKINSQQKTDKHDFPTGTFGETEKVREVTAQIQGIKRSFLRENTTRIIIVTFPLDTVSFTISVYSPLIYIKLIDVSLFTSSNSSSFSSSAHFHLDHLKNNIPGEFQRKKKRSH